MKIAIIGSRSVTVDHYEILCEKVPIGASQIISGGAKGADTLAMRYAQDNHLPFINIIPNYKKYGKRAPLIRNREIIASSDYVIALWDGKSRGTAQVIDVCICTYTPVRVIICHPKPLTAENYSPSLASSS